MSNDDARLTEKIFWEKYWQQISLPSSVNLNFSFERCLSKTLLSRLSDINFPDKVRNHYKVLEVGAAPGKWMHLMAENGFSVSGVEYSNEGIKILKENLRLLEVEPLDLIHGDFFSIEPEPIYDIVMSFGFIEHFEDAETVIARHKCWLKPNGLLIIGVPNFTGLHGGIQKMLDKSVYYSHNINIMNKKFFTDKVPAAVGLAVLSFDYLGSFEPSLPMSFHRINFYNFIPKLIIRFGLIFRQWRGFDNLNSAFLSSYLLTIYRNSEVKK